MINILFYILIGLFVLIGIYVVLRLFAFSLFKSYFQAKGEFLSGLNKQKKEEYRDGK